MQRALAELRVEGIDTTVPIHQDILSHSAFVEGRIERTHAVRPYVEYVDVKKRDNRVIELDL